MKRILMLMVIALVLFSFVGCLSSDNEENSEFNFEIEVPEFAAYNYQLVSGMDDGMARFRLRVITTYSPDDSELYYHTASGFIGGYPTIILPNGEGITPMPNSQYCEGDYMTDLAKGDFVVVDWFFELPYDFNWGAYDIKVNYNGEQQIFEDVEITPDTCDIFKNARFDFEVEIDITNLQIINGENNSSLNGDLVCVDLNVKTICVDGRYKYLSATSPAFDGGVPTIILPSGEMIRHEPFEKAMGFDEVDIKSGDIKNASWRFYIPAGLFSGECDIRVDLANGIEKLFEDVSIEIGNNYRY